MSGRRRRRTDNETPQILANEEWLNLAFPKEIISLGKFKRDKVRDVRDGDARKKKEGRSVRGVVHHKAERK